MKLEDYREKIDTVDEKLVALFAERMELSRAIAECKKENGLPVLDASREKEKLDRVAEQSPAELREYTRSLYTLLIELSRDYQRELIGKERGCCSCADWLGRSWGTAIPRKYTKCSPGTNTGSMSAERKSLKAS